MSEQRGLKALETWAKRVTSGYNGVNVRDMTSSFRDGLAFCAIIHHYYPELIDFDSLSKENILCNNSLAFSVAEKKLGVPALLDAEDMVNYAVPDRLSIATYLAQLRNCFENNNRVNKVKPAVKRVLKEGQCGPPTKLLGDSRNSTQRSHETCQVCKHRVFLLERLMVDKKLYHRTCFKCSKCGTLLQPGAYVESDVTGTYECAICPRDEKKEPEQKPSDYKSVSDHEMSNGVDLSNASTPAVSPLPTPRLPVLSTKFNNARNDFLQKSIGVKQEESEHDLSSSSKSSSSSESLSRNSDHQAFEDSPRNLDSGFKDESASEDISSEILKIPVETERNDIKESFPTSPVQPLGLKTESTSNGTRKPYQSIFTRELLSTTAFKPISAPRSAEMTSSLGLKRLSSSKLTADIPLIRSTSYTTTSLHVENNSGLEPKGSVSASSLLAGNRHPSYSIDENVNHKYGSNLRRSSLGTNGHQNVDHLKLDQDVRLRHGSDQNLSVVKPASMSLGSDTLNSALESESRKLDRPNREHGSGASVRQLIQLREASIRDSKLPVSVYKPSTSFTAKQKVSEQNGKSLTDSETKDLYLSNNFVGGDVDEAHDEENIVEDDKISQEPVSEVIPKPRRKSRSQSKSIEELSSTATSDELDAKVLVDQSDFSVPIDQKDSKISVAHRGNENEAESQEAVQDNKTEIVKYPIDLNPFGDDGEEEDTKNPFESDDVYPDDLNPFGDDENEDVKNTKIKVCVTGSYDESKNPFASDDDDVNYEAKPPPPPAVSKSPIKSPVPTNVSTKSPPCQQTLPRFNSTVSPTGSVKGTLKKRPAPKAPHVRELFLNTSHGSETSLSTMDSTSPIKMSPSPKVRKNKRAPPPPSPSIGSRQQSVSGKDVKSPTPRLSSPPSSKDVDQKSLSAGSEDSIGSSWKKKKRPAPPVPIPQRREIKKIPLHEIKKEMGEIEEKQNELENQGRELEVLIRDRDKDEEPTVEEEEYIMQLFELVNQKNALFRRQAELMYIKRSQRLEEEQVELEFQIRCLMTKPESQKTDEDKVREEKLVKHLLDVVDQRNEIVDSIEMDRRREAEEDVSVQEQMDIKTGDLPITAEIKQKSQKKDKKHKEKKKKKKKAKEGKKDEEEDTDKKGTLRKKWF